MSKVRGLNRDHLVAHQTMLPNGRPQLTSRMAQGDCGSASPAANTKRIHPVLQTAGNAVLLLVSSH